ncbi:hypothetical protein BDB00DRAFT_872677 [Zychaea mexicana]|uniref:uncharacterized protein n=1 Tax=Zychaea mexicana TaxID=64656 RepID=UPI0022FF2AAE|nr:uncharacterized protein BDB00DRAFT_872677 [Zychaea mexicana]KAI9493162.1 hypothetical protein BDB00DRAFT_872677 [Zychaea mexicana]
MSSAKFYYEGGHGNIVDESGQPEPMDYIINEKEHVLETLTTHTQYLAKMPDEVAPAPKNNEAMRDEQPAATDPLKKKRLFRSRLIERMETYCRKAIIRFQGC